jgi:hypothetical protein
MSWKSNGDTNHGLRFGRRPVGIHLTPVSCHGMSGFAVWMLARTPGVLRSSRDVRRTEHFTDCGMSYGLRDSLQRDAPVWNPRYRVVGVRRLS